MGFSRTDHDVLKQLVETSDELWSYRQAAKTSTAVSEDLASGMRGWLKGVSKGVDTWRSKLKADGSSGATKALDGLDAAIESALKSLGESRLAESLDPKARKALVMALYKRFKSMGDGMIKDGKHQIMLGGEDYRTVVLEDLSDEELRELVAKYAK